MCVARLLYTSGSSLQQVDCCTHLLHIPSGSSALCVSLVCCHQHFLARSLARFGSATRPRTFGDAMGVCPNNAPSAERLASGRLKHLRLWQRSNKKGFTGALQSSPVQNLLRKHEMFPSQRFRRNQNISTTADLKHVWQTSQPLPTHLAPSQIYMSLPIATVASAKSRRQHAMLVRTSTVEPL